MITLKLTNTLSKHKEIFKPITEPVVLMYVCGITPYDYSHIGHGRTYVNFDLVFRFLKYIGYNVTYVRNFTDIDDKIIAKAIAESIPLETSHTIPNIPSSLRIEGWGDEKNKRLDDYRAISEKFIAAYHEDMQQLNCLAPTVEPKVTENIPQIIDFITGLIAQEKAYVIDHDVYFDLASFPDYGALSGRKQEDLLAGARVDVDQRKKNPGDFALWKGNTENKFWQSPWGYGRPGWHIECSVMAQKHLGKTIDIHGGGMDLIFPHHENEKAQSEGLNNQPFVRIWLHNAFVNINKEKMSKSLGNFITLKNIFEHTDPMVLRFFILQHHYRTPIDFNADDLAASHVAYKRLVAHLSSDNQNNQNNTHFFSLQTVPDNAIAQAILDALGDDLNTPKCLGIIFEHLTTIKQNPILLGFIQTLMTHVLGLTLEPLTEKAVPMTPEIQNLIAQREQARAEKNWAQADKLRDQLKQLGYDVQDKKL